MTKSSFEKLCIGEIKAKKLIQEYQTPLYVYDEQKIEEQYLKLKNAFQETKLDFEINYAVKANNNPHIVEKLVELGAGLDCASKAEVMLASKLTKSEKIMYTAPFTPKDELDFISKKNVTMNFNSVEQLERTEKLPERISFRVDPGIGEGDFGLVLGGGSKFGIPEEEIVEAYQKALEHGVERFGIHMMTGSGILNPEYFGDITAKIMEIADRINSETGITFEFIDIGGGLGIPYKPEQEELDIEETVSNIARKFQEGVEEHEIGEPKLMIEPGRFLVSQSGYLLTQITGVKEKDDTSYVGVDTGMHQFIRPMLYDAYHEITPIDNKESEVEEKTVVGLVCENTDKIAVDRKLPELETGEYIAVKDVGAYGFTMASNWNSRPLPAEIMVDGDDKRVIREKQKPEDIFHGTKTEYF